MVNPYVMKSEHDLFIDCLPYEWRSGTSDGIFFGYKIGPRMMGMQVGYNKNYHIECIEYYEKFDSL